jgi:hypothetical protein
MGTNCKIIGSCGAAVALNIENLNMSKCSEKPTIIFDMDGYDCKPLI